MTSTAFTVTHILGNPRPGLDGECLISMDIEFEPLKENMYMYI